VPCHRAERRYNAPLLTPGTRLLLPAGVTAVPIQDYYHHPHLAPAESAWPHMTATDGTTVDAPLMNQIVGSVLVEVPAEITGRRRLNYWATTAIRDRGPGRRRCCQRHLRCAARGRRRARQPHPTPGR
jgi:hypothetical protein